MSEPELSVAEAKARFSELIERVARGERFLVHRRGKPAVALVAPDAATAVSQPAGLLAAIGGLADWDELEAVVDEIYRERARARDRAAPPLA